MLIDIHMIHEDAVGITEGEMFMILAIGRDDFNRTGLVHLQCELSGSENMSAPVGQCSAGIISPETPAGLRLVRLRCEVAGGATFIVRRLRSRTQPQIPMELLGIRFRLAGQIAADRWAATGDVNFFDLAVAAGPHGAGQATVVAQNSLAAAANNPLVTASRFDHRTPPVDGQCERLLAIHVLTLLARFNRHGSVPVMRGGNHHRVDVFSCQ